MSAIRKTSLLIGISLLSFIGYLDATIVSTALPAIQSSLHMTVSSLQWVMNASFLAISALMASMGRLADIYGRRKVLYVGVIIFGLASIGAAFAPNAGLLIFYRAILGACIAIAIPVGVSIVHHEFDEKTRAKALGIYSAITGAGLALGPLVGGILVNSFGWPSIFLVNIPFILLGLILCVGKLKESRSELKMKVDYFGIIFLSLTMTAFLYSISEANQYGWSSPSIVGGFIVGGFSLIALIISEAKASDPILPGWLFKNKVFISSFIYFLAASSLMSIIMFIDPLYLNIIAGQNSFVTGLILFIIPAVLVLSSPLIGRLNVHWGPRRLILLSCLLYFAAASLHLSFNMTLNYTLITLAFIAFGLSWSIVNQAPALALGKAISGDHFGSALGALYGFYNTGAALGLALGVVVFHMQASWTLTKEFAGQTLSATQQNLLNQFATQPNTLQTVASQFNPNSSSIEIAGIESCLKQSFLNGMHSMFWIAGLLSVAAFITVFIAMRDKKN